MLRTRINVQGRVTTTRETTRIKATFGYGCWHPLTPNTTLDLTPSVTGFFVGDCALCVRTKRKWLER